MRFCYRDKVGSWGCKYQILFLIVVIAVLFISNTVVAEMLSVKGDKINIRSGPGIKYPAKWEYGSGFPVQVIQKKGSWIKIKDFENDKGWIHRSLLVDTPKMIVKANRNIDKNINIRLKPSTNADIVGRAYYGVVFSTLEKKPGWVKVEHDSGLTGWISKSLLWGY